MGRGEGYRGEGKLTAKNGLCHGRCEERFAMEALFHLTWISHPHDVDTLVLNICILNMDGYKFFNRFGPFVKPYATTEMTFLLFNLSTSQIISFGL